MKSKQICISVLEQNNEDVFAKCSFLSATMVRLTVPLMAENATVPT